MHQLRKVQQIRRKKKSHKYKVERKKPDREHTLFESIYIKFKIQPNYLLVMSQETFFFSSPKLAVGVRVVWGGQRGPWHAVTTLPPGAVDLVKMPQTARAQFAHFSV